MQCRKAEYAVHQEGALEGESDDVRLEDPVNEGDPASLDGKRGISLCGVKPKQFHVVLVGTGELDRWLVDDDEVGAPAAVGSVILRTTAGVGGWARGIVSVGEGRYGRDSRGSGRAYREW